MKRIQLGGASFIITPDTLAFLLSFLALANDSFKGSCSQVEDCTRANCHCSNKVKVKTISGILNSLYGWIYRLRNDNCLGLGDWSWLPRGSRGWYKVQHRGPHGAAAAAVTSVMCDPIDGSPPGSPDPGILQARTLERVAISFSNAGNWKVKVKSLSHVRPSVTPWTAAYQAPPSMGFSRQEYWSGVPLPSPLHRARRWFAVIPVLTIWWKLSWCSRNRISQDLHLLEVKFRVNL